MRSSKSDRKSDAKLLDAIKRLRGEIKNHDMKVLEELESLRDYIRKENSNLLLRDLGIITLTFGGLLMAFSFSFPQLGLGNLVWNTFGAGFLFVLSGLSFIISSFGPFIKPSRGSLRDAFCTAKKYPYKTLMAFVGLALAILGFITILIIP